VVARADVFPASSLQLLGADLLGDELSAKVISLIQAETELFKEVSSAIDELHSTDGLHSDQLQCVGSTGDVAFGFHHLGDLHRQICVFSFEEDAALRGLSKDVEESALLIGGDSLEEAHRGEDDSADDLYELSAALDEVCDVIVEGFPGTDPVRKKKRYI